MDSDQHDNLRKNLLRLRRKDPELAERVRTASDESCEIMTGRTGAVTIVSHGVQLGSAYDPKKEAETIAAEIIAAKPDLVVAVGFGLGHYLEAIRRHCRGRLIVYEPSPERMRAALAARPAMILLVDRDLDFASTPERLFRLVESRYIPGLKLQVYLHPPTLKLEPKAVRDAVEQISRAKDYIDISIGTRVRYLQAWGRKTMENAGAIVGNPSFKELFGRFRNVPAVVVSAGPSLDKQLPLLAKYRDRLLVVCIGQALGALRSAGIEPDLVHILESKRVEHQLTRVGSSDNVNLVVTNDVTPGLFEVPVRNRFVATPVADKIGRWIATGLDREGWVTGGSTVAHGAVSLAVALGASPIMLIGQDLAYTGGRHYATGSAYDQVTVELGEDGYSKIHSSSRSEMLGFGKKLQPKRIRVVWVDGWYGEKVPTSPSYAGFIDGYKTLAEWCRSVGSKVINCTEGGARIDGLEHLSFAETLDRFAVDAVDASRIIDECHAQAPVCEATRITDAIARARNLLDKMEKNADNGVELCARVSRELKRTRSPQRQIDLLRQVGRLEKDLRVQLASISWIDAVVQPEITASAAETRRGENADATPEQAVKEATFLFETAKHGVERARELLEVCAESLNKQARGLDAGSSDSVAAPKPASVVSPAVC